MASGWPNHKRRRKKDELLESGPPDACMGRAVFLKAALGIWLLALGLSVSVIGDGTLLISTVESKGRIDQRNPTILSGRDLSKTIQS